MPISEYPSGASFPGVIGRTADESTPAWPAPVRAPKDAPNVLFIVLDDTGFGQLGCYGSPIATPNLDRLAERGLRYNNMHTTALCSPSRSCVITGRNHHSNAMACITEMATGYPGYNGLIPFENGFLSEMLLEHGYNTYMIGKWHLIPAARRLRRARMTAGRSAAGSSASTGSSAATRASGIRTWSMTIIRSSRRRRARGGLPPHRGSDRPGDPVHRRRQAGRPRQAVLPALLHRRDARAAPRAEGVGGPLQGRVRRRLGRLPREGVRAPEGARDRPAARASSHATTPTCPSGTRSATTSAAYTPG